MPRHELDGHRQPPDFVAGGPRPHAGSRISRTQALDLIRLDDLDRSCGQDLNRRRPDVVCPWRPFARTGAHCFSFGATAWGVAKPMAKSPREMGVVAKAAGVRDLAERLACLQRYAAMQKARSVIQTKRVNEFVAGRATRREQLLQVTQRDSRFGCDFARAEIRIGKAPLDDVADTPKQSLRMARDGKRIGRRKQRAEEIIDRKPHVGIGWKDRRSFRTRSKSRCAAGVSPRACNPPCGSHPRWDRSNWRGSCRRSQCESPAKHAEGRAASSNATSPTASCTASSFWVITDRPAT